MMAILIEVRNGSGIVGRCDARCYDAKSPHCDCICGGANHGKGKEAATENAKKHGHEWLETARALDPDCFTPIGIQQGLFE